MGIFGFFSKKDKKALDKGLEKTKGSFINKISKAVVGKSKVDTLLLDELEEALISSDVGIDTTVKIIARLEARVARDKYLGTEELNNILKEEIIALLTENKSPDLKEFVIPKMNTPYVILVIGVNGVGKTTTIGKLAHQFKQQGKNVLIGAADTFRAAAIEQLVILAERVGVPIVHKEMNSDPASVAFDSVEAAKSRDVDVVIVDTAGRLHNKVNLMEELSKIKRVMSKVIPEAPHEIMLVLDASIGQNAIQQAKEFTKFIDISSIALTKLDGTAKGGVVLGIADQFQIPIKYIGIGEKMEHLQVFNKAEFVDSLFNN